MRFACFIMTFKRPVALEDTINKLFSQSFPPQKILIVDNDPEKSAENILNKFLGKSISYYPVGYNSGPAGAAYYGLKILADEGWEWIGWVDDDDPPVFVNQFERIFDIEKAKYSFQNIGIMGAVGAKFNKYKIDLVRLGDKELFGVIDVDMIAGNQFPIVSRRVIEKGILPFKDIFFGFEELEFCLRVKKAGFRILSDGELHRDLRYLNRRINLQKTIVVERSLNALWRNYYSIRTLVYIFKGNRLLNLFYLLIKISIKSFFLFKNGFKYGFLHFRYSFAGFYDGIFGRFGLRITPQSKNHGQVL